MKIELYKNKDFWAGMMLIAIGAGAMLIAREYRFGSALRMGPGFFPIILGGILVVFGLCVVAVGIRSGEKITGRISPRALILLPLALLLFGFLMDRAGFIPALAVLVFVSAAAGREFKFLEVLMLTGLSTVAAIALFVWGLGLPYPLLKGF